MQVSTAALRQPLTALKPSRYNVLVPLRDGRALAWNGLSGALAVLDEDDRAAIDRAAASGTGDLADEGLRQLVHAGYLVLEGADELAVLERHYRAHRFDPGSMILTIAPTMACNFGCDYCFQGADKPSGTMGQEVQDAIVALVEKEAPALKHLHVAWYGGEPLLRLPVIEALSDRIIAVCDAHEVGYDAMIVSNGFRLTEASARSLWERRVKTVQVTLDGDAVHHDTRRVLLSGGVTFKRIVKNLASVVNAVPITIAVRVNVDSRNAQGIRLLIDRLHEAGLGGRPNLQLYFAPVEAMTTGCHSVEEVCMSKADFGQLEADLSRHAFERGLAGLPYPNRYRGTCSAVRPKGWTILPDGAIHKCWDTVGTPGHAVGSIFQPEALAEDARVRPWLEWTPFQQEACRNCRLLPSCAGACAYKVVHAGETRGEAARLPCPSWKYNLNERLLLRAEKMGFIQASDYDVEAVRTDPAALCVDPHPTALHSHTLPAAAR